MDIKDQIKDTFEHLVAAFGDKFSVTNDLLAEALVSQIANNRLVCEEEELATLAAEVVMEAWMGNQEFIYEEVFSEFLRSIGFFFQLYSEE